MIKTFYALSCLITMSIYPAAHKRSSIIAFFDEDQEEEKVLRFSTLPQIDLALETITQADDLLIRVRTGRSLSEPDIHRLEESLEHLSEDLINATVWNSESANIRLNQSISALEELLPRQFKAQKQ